VFRTIIAPSFLIMLCPPIVGLIWFTHTKVNGSVAKLAERMASEGVAATIWQVWAADLSGLPDGVGNHHRLRRGGTRLHAPDPGKA
jgi:hypothetical protein